MENFFEKANSKVWPVETQWHYPIMIKAGFTAQTKEDVGLVRNYDYSKDDKVIRCTTGASTDYWAELNTKKGGRWYELEKYVQSL